MLNMISPCGQWSDHAEICAEEHHRAIFSFVASLLESRLSKVITLHACCTFFVSTICDAHVLSNRYGLKCTFSSQVVTVIVELQQLPPVWMAMLHNATACRHSIVVTRQESYWF
jgi:hypothetical protein